MPEYMTFKMHARKNAKLKGRIDFRKNATFYCKVENQNTRKKECQQMPEENVRQTGLMPGRMIRIDARQKIGKNARENARTYPTKEAT